MSGDTGEDMDRIGLARAYYDSLDGHDYERLRSILAPAFVHERPDLTLEGRDRFVQFMREERPDPDTTHAVESVYRSTDRVAVTGRLYRADDTLMTAFLDDFTFEPDDAGDPVISAIETYSRVKD